MENLTQITPKATARLTPAEAQKRVAEADRRAAYIERQTAEYQGYIAALQELYQNGSLKRAQPAPGPSFKEAATFVTTRLPGGAAASQTACKGAKTRRARSVDTSPEAEARRERRRARRLARKQRQAQATA